MILSRWSCGFDSVGYSLKLFWRAADFALWFHWIHSLRCRWQWLHRVATASSSSSTSASSSSSSFSTSPSSSSSSSSSSSCQRLGSLSKRCKSCNLTILRFFPSFVFCLFFRGALRPQKPYGLLGTGKGGVGSGTCEQLVPNLRPVKTEETVSHRQNDVKEVGTPPAPSNLSTSLTAVSTAVRNKVTKTVSEKQLLRNNSAARQSIQLLEPSSTSLLLISPSLWYDLGWSWCRMPWIFTRMPGFSYRRRLRSVMFFVTPVTSAGRYKFNPTCLLIRGHNSCPRKTPTLCPNTLVGDEVQ